MASIPRLRACARGAGAVTRNRVSRCARVAGGLFSSSVVTRCRTVTPRGRASFSRRCLSLPGPRKAIGSELGRVALVSALRPRRCEHTLGSKATPARVRGSRRVRCGHLHSPWVVADWESDIVDIHGPASGSASGGSVADVLCGLCLVGGETPWIHNGPAGGGWISMGQGAEGVAKRRVSSGELASFHTPIDQRLRRVVERCL